MKLFIYIVHPVLIMVTCMFVFKLVSVFKFVILPAFIFIFVLLFVFLPCNWIRSCWCLLPSSLCLYYFMQVSLFLSTCLLNTMFHSWFFILLWNFWFWIPVHHRTWLWSQHDCYPHSWPVRQMIQSDSRSTSCQRVFKLLWYCALINFFIKWHHIQVVHC